jgi:tetratricopeptide (TPR) repeat protein
MALLAFAVGGRATPRTYRNRLLLGVAPLFVVALVLFGAPWLAAKEVRAAGGQWRDDPAAAFDRLGRARKLNPLSDWPDVVAGVIASRVGDEQRMIASFRRALERNPANWYSHLELAVAYSHLGQGKAALRELRQVERLNPLEPTIPLVRDGIRRGRPVSTLQLDTIFLRRTFVSNRDRPG